MADPRVERLAGVLVEYSTRVGEGDLVCIDSPLPGAPLVRALYREILEAGGHPQLRTELDGTAEALLSNGTDAQLEWVNPARFDEVERADVRIAVEAETNTRALTGVDPARQALHARAREPLRKRHFERSAAGQLRSVVTLYPTQAAAQDAEMSLEEYEQFVYAAGLLDSDDPVSEWARLGERFARLAEWLGAKSELRVVGDGTDLTVGVAGRTWIPCDGRENFPDGEVFTGPVETSVHGTVRFTYPASFGGRRVSGIELEFEAGEVVRARAARGEGFLREMLALDDGARRAGEFSFGLNDAVREFTGHTLFDEKIGGTVHLALGASYPESGGQNESALHWDLVCDLRAGSEVYADGELAYRDGRFLDGVP
ncbi:MAG TPA: aminopeptidase [Gaiellaceae bacterium]|nr:aminopeptidase [Gaiellaceae bacterium]